MRRPLFFLSSTTFLHPILATKVGYSPLSDPLYGISDESLLVKRQGCQSGYSACSDLGADAACCPPDTLCTLDQAGHVACCPYNAVCTGTVDATITGTVTTTSSPTGTSTTGAIITSSTTPFQTAASLTGVEGGYSTVQNAPYPFIYIPTSYANADLCFTAFSQASAQSTACVGQLAGVNGVTVSGVGMGITIQGASGTVVDSASAASICSSLSSSACYGLQSDVCSTINGGTDSTGGLPPQNGMPRQTACPGLVYAAGAGVLAGALGGWV